MSDKSLKQVQPSERRIANIFTSEVEDWSSDSTVATGQSVLQLNRTNPPGVGFHVLKMAPGTATESHEHSGDEEFLILSGDLIDNDGTEYQEGDLVWMKQSTQHNSTTVTGYVLAVYIPTSASSIE